MDKLENRIQPINQITDKHMQLFLEADPSQEIIESYLSRAYKFELVCGKDLLGVVLLLDTHPRTVEIVNIAVNEKYRNHGLGEDLINFACDWAKKHHYKIIEIGTGSTSFAQLYLYQKCGFRVVNIDTNFFVDNYSEPIIENRLVLKDMLRLKKVLP